MRCGPRQISQTCDRPFLQGSSHPLADLFQAKQICAWFVSLTYLPLTLASGSLPLPLPSAPEPAAGVGVTWGCACALLCAAAFRSACVFLLFLGPGSPPLGSAPPLPAPAKLEIDQLRATAL